MNACPCCTLYSPKNCLTLVWNSENPLSQTTINKRWPEAKSKLTECRDCSTGRGLAADSFCTSLLALAHFYSVTQRKVPVTTSSQRHSNKISVVCLTTDKLCPCSPFVWLVYFAADVSLGTGILQVHGAVLFWPWLNIIKDQEEGPGGCCWLCPNITELQVHLIGFFLQKKSSYYRKF